MSTKALAEYRQGHFAGAVEWTEKVSRLPDFGDYVQVDSLAVRALAEYRLDQTNAARLTLAKGVEIADTKLPKLESGNLGRGPFSWMIAHALLREARALIERPTAEHSVRNTAADTSAAEQSRPQPPAVKPPAPANNGPK